MKVLIGTPIHVNKDYSMERWLKSVSKLEYPADLLMVDNSPGTDYVKKVKTYCAKYGVKYYEIEHVESDQRKSLKARDLRIEKGQEIIRQRLLAKDYDAWFSWESDVILPPNALDELVKIMKVGNFMIVAHNCWYRWSPNTGTADFEITLISRKCLEKYGSLLAWIRRADYPDMSKSMQRGSDESFFKNRVLRNKDSTYAEAYNVIKPIYHLDR